MLLSSSRFQQVLGVTPCPQTETCHPQDIRLVLSEVGGMRMSEGSQRKLLAGSKEQGNVAAAFRLAVGLASKKRSSAIINQMVSSRFRYVPKRGRASFPAQSLAVGRAAQFSYFPPPRCEMADDKAKMLEAAIAQIEKSHGKGAIMRLGSRDVLVPVSVIPTGCLSLDAALGVGGFPRGRVVEVYGPESGGKTTMTLHVIAEAQKLGGTAAFIDAEHALDPVYARKLGVDDSVAALVPKAELEGEMGDPQMGLQARLMSQALRKLTAIVSKSRTCLIFINQIREKIGVMFGNPETTTGGRALKFYSSVRVDIRRIAAIKEGDVVTGSRTKVKVVKNKVAAPFREAEFDILYGQGISKEGDVLDVAVNHGLLEKSGAWFSYKGERIGQGRENARQFLKENKEIFTKLEAEVRKHLGLTSPGV